MLIILAVIVVIGIVFLMIYNSRSSRKAAEARASKIAEVDEGPVLLHEEDQARKEDRIYAEADHAEVLEHADHRQTEIHQMDSTWEVPPSPQKRETQTTDGDQAYRQALLHFRKPAEVEEEAVLTETKEPEKSADEVYRSALKVMKSKSSELSSKRK
jgi:FtsZ-interacting cell division protein ZipA